MSTSGVPWERPEAEHVGSWPHLACRPTRDVFCQTKEKPNCLKEIFLFFKPLKLGEGVYLLFQPSPHRLIQISPMCQMLS